MAETFVRWWLERHEPGHSFWPQSLQDWGDVAQAAALLIGAALALVLYARQRRRFPRAKISHSVLCRAISEDLVLIRLSIEVKNIGEVLLSLCDAQAQLLHLLPAPAELASRRTGVDNPYGDKIPEFTWLSLGFREQKWVKREQEIEPGESDSIHFDFVIDRSVEEVLVYSHVSNAAKRKPWYTAKREIGWNTTTPFSIVKALRPEHPNGTVHDRNGGRSGRSVPRPADARSGPSAAVTPPAGAAARSAEAAAQQSQVSEEVTMPQKPIEKQGNPKPPPRPMQQPPSPPKKTK